MKKNILEKIKKYEEYTPIVFTILFALILILFFSLMQKIKTQDNASQKQEIIIELKGLNNFEEFIKQAKLDYFQFDTLLSEQDDLQIGLTTNTITDTQSLYVLIDNKYLVVDSVYDLQGNNISLANAEKAKAYASRVVPEIAKTQDKTTDKANEQLNQAYNNINTSNGYYQFDFETDKTIYVYYDLDCGYCQKSKDLFEEHKDLFAEHKLNVYWLPVAILSNDLEKISDRLAKSISPEQIAENTDDFNNLGVQGVPVFMWKEQDTVMGYIGGMQKKDLFDIFDRI